MKLKRSTLSFSQPLRSFTYEGIEYITDQYILLPLSLAAHAIKRDDPIEELDNPENHFARFTADLIPVEKTKLLYLCYNKPLSIVKTNDDIHFIYPDFLDILNNHGTIQYSTSSKAFISTFQNAHIVAMPFSLNLTKNDIIALL